MFTKTEVVSTAPEMLGGKGKGYTCSVDWWSLAVTAYELLFYVRPFDG